MTDHNSGDHPPQPKVRGFTHLADDAPRRSARAWHDRLQASFKRLTDDPELLASIERRSF